MAAMGSKVAAEVNHRTQESYFNDFVLIVMVHSEQAAAQAHRSLLVNSLQRGNGSSADVQITIESVCFTAERPIVPGQVNKLCHPLVMQRPSAMTYKARQGRFQYSNQIYQNILFTSANSTKNNTTGRRTFVTFDAPQPQLGPDASVLANLGCFELRKRVRTHESAGRCEQGVVHNLSISVPVDEEPGAKTRDFWVRGCFAAPTEGESSRCERKSPPQSLHQKKALNTAQQTALMKA